MMQRESVTITIRAHPSQSGGQSPNLMFSFFVALTFLDVVRLWDGGSGTKRKSLLKKDPRGIYNAVRNFWNHRKAEKLGSLVFMPICSTLYQVRCSLSSVCGAYSCSHDVVRDVILSICC